MNRASRFAVVVFATFALAGCEHGRCHDRHEALAEGPREEVGHHRSLPRSSTRRARYDANKEIYTYFTLRVLEPVKGSAKDQVITIRQIGGVVGTIASIVPGTPSFKKGEEVVVFLTQRDVAGYPWVMGLQQGKYSVSADENGQKRVRNELDGLKLMGANGSVMDDGAKVSPNMPLQAFLDGIRTDLDDAGKVKVDPTPRPSNGGRDT